DYSMEISARNKMSVALLWLGDLNKIDELLEVSEQLAKQYQDIPGMAEMYMTRCQRYLVVADFPTALKYFSESIEVGKKLTVNELRMFGLAHLANTLTYMGRFDEAWQTAQECQELAMQIGERLHLSETLSFAVAYHHMLNGDLDAAYGAAQEGLQHAEKIGFGISQFIARYMLTMVMQARGEHEQVLQGFQKALEIANSTGIPMMIVMALSSLGSA